MSKTAANVGLNLHDDGSGNLTSDGVGTINYLTGAYTLTWSLAPASGEPITSQTIVYKASRPQAVLYYDDVFTLRPVPDKVYPIQMEVYRRPTQLMNNAAAEPQLEQWWQYIAYGAAKKIFEDRMDLESVQLIMPEFKKQEALVLRRTIVQQTTQRTATIYEDSTASQYGTGS